MPATVRLAGRRGRERGLRRRARRRPRPADVLGAGATPRTAPVGTVEHPLPLIIDSDPGLDDALAIGLAVARPELASSP